MAWFAWPLSTGSQPQAGFASTNGTRLRHCGVWRAQVTGSAQERAFDTANRTAAKKEPAAPDENSGGSGNGSRIPPPDRRSAGRACRSYFLRAWEDLPLCGLALDSASFGKSPIMVFRGHTETTGHFLQPETSAIGQSVIVIPLRVGGCRRNPSLQCMPFGARCQHCSRAPRARGPSGMDPRHAPAGATGLPVVEGRVTYSFRSAFDFHIQQQDRGCGSSQVDALFCGKVAIQVHAPGIEQVDERKHGSIAAEFETGRVG